MNDFKVFRNLLGYLRGILWRKKDKPNYGATDKVQ